MPKPFTGVLTVTLCLALGACNDEPTEPAMRDAVARLFAKIRLQQAAAATASGRQDGSAPKAIVISSFDKTECLPAEPAEGHTCSFMVSLDGAERMKSYGRFYRAADGTLTATSK